ncbi:hypothetical protein [Aristaeella hokkaidonensis]|uniref:Uncharacterized protein n=1 Tax=Aristaeella hokkaidonensis TaxID=3046382 RepID=A0AC61NK14_9FIRM|nr:hypothetical protein [Aristaeella hokkaidonensis]QUC66278.1 hypothetical protein JYE49_10440 [Aristaeella hokkaidonensis]SNT94314.1 hypothetical protein SAMN06297421_104288 [Aristaeella hokkaidonensis]
MKTDKDFRLGVIALLFIAVLVIVRGYYRTKLDWLQLPEDTTVYLGTRIEANDINWAHCVVEKVVRCEQGLDWFREYLKEHNTVEQLEGVNVCPFDVLNDMNHYCYDWLKESARREVREDGIEKYIIIKYWVYGAKGKSQWSLLD